MPHLVEPGEKVVAGNGEVESRAFGGNGIPDQLGRSGLLCHQGVTDVWHAWPIPGSRPRETPVGQEPGLYRFRPIRNPAISPPIAAMVSATHSASSALKNRNDTVVWSRLIAMKMITTTATTMPPMARPLSPFFLAGAGWFGYWDTIQYRPT